MNGKIHGMTNPKKPGMKRLDLGATGQAVARNIKRLRESQALSYAELSRRTADLGQELSTLALRRIEAEARRVDVDDLAALAMALGVAPTTFLMPEVENDYDQVGITGCPIPMDADRVWSWMVAAQPLQIDEMPQVNEFLVRSRPAFFKHSMLDRIIVDPRIDEELKAALKESREKEEQMVRELGQRLGKDIDGNG